MLYIYSTYSYSPSLLHSPSPLRSFTPSLLHSFAPSEPCEKSIPTALHSFTPSLLHSFTPSEPCETSIPTALHSFTLLNSFTLSLLQNHVGNRFRQPFTLPLSFTPSLVHSFRTIWQIDSYSPSLLHAFTPSPVHSFRTMWKKRFLQAFTPSFSFTSSLLRSFRTM